MNKFLKSASDRFQKIQEKEYLIHPISEIDCEIIVELGQILKKAGLEDVVQILNSYKSLKDEEIRDELLSWNIDHPAVSKSADETASNEKEEPLKKAPFVWIGDNLMKIYDLIGLSVYERFDEEYQGFKFGVTINPTPEHTLKKPMFADTNIEWFSDEDRKQFISNLESLCAEYGVDLINLT
jgi:hypothetical protein